MYVRSGTAYGKKYDKYYIEKDLREIAKIYKMAEDISWEDEYHLFGKLALWIEKAKLKKEGRKYKYSLEFTDYPKENVVRFKFLQENINIQEVMWFWQIFNSYNKTFFFFFKNIQDYNFMKAFVKEYLNNEFILENPEIIKFSNYYPKKICFTDVKTLKNKKVSDVLLGKRMIKSSKSAYLYYCFQGLVFVFINDERYGNVLKKIGEDNYFFINLNVKNTKKELKNELFKYLLYLYLEKRKKRKVPTPKYKKPSSGKKKKSKKVVKWFISSYIKNALLKGKKPSVLNVYKKYQRMANIFNLPKYEVGEFKLMFNLIKQKNFLDLKNNQEFLTFKGA